MPQVGLTAGTWECDLAEMDPDKERAGYAQLMLVSPGI